MIKAYYLSIKDNDDAGAVVVFAETAKEAKKHYHLSDDISEAAQEDWTSLVVRREKRYDGMEKLSNAELAMHQWRDGWRWFEQSYPDPDTATDAEFLEWYKNTFGEAKTI